MCALFGVHHSCISHLETTYTDNPTAAASLRHLVAFTAPTTSSCTSADAHAAVMCITMSSDSACQQPEQLCCLHPTLTIPTSAYAVDSVPSPRRINQSVNSESGVKSGDGGCKHTLAQQIVSKFATGVMTTVRL